MDDQNVLSEVMRLNKYVGECRVEWEMAKARACDCDIARMHRKLAAYDKAKEGEG